MYLPSFVGMLSDEVVLDNLDDALRVILLPVCRATDRLFELGFTPSGDIPTLTLAASIFVWRYNECRDIGVPIEDSIKVAYGSVISNPNVSRYLAMKGYLVVNNAAGVNTNEG